MITLNDCPEWVPGTPESEEHMRAHTLRLVEEFHARLLVEVLRAGTSSDLHG